jgi:hypothetical protein
MRSLLILNWGTLSPFPAEPEHNEAMALKKSELYSSLWSSCDELRGGMDASQYKDYVLVLLFIKYVSDKYAGVTYAEITVPPGASFKDMVALKDIDSPWQCQINWFAGESACATSALDTRRRMLQTVL